MLLFLLAVIRELAIISITSAIIVIIFIPIIAMIKHVACMNLRVVGSCGRLSFML